MARPTKKLTTTIDLVNKSISIIPSRSRKHYKIQTNLKKYITNLTKCGNYLSTQVIPSLTLGNMGYAVLRFMNSGKNTRSLHSAPTCRALPSPSKRPILSPRLLSSKNLPFSIIRTKYSQAEPMKILTKDSTQTVSKQIQLMNEKNPNKEQRDLQIVIII